MNAKIIVTIVLLIAVGISYTTQLDQNAIIVHEEAMERAMSAFFIAKALNAVISLIQGTELSFTPVGIGLTFTIGEVLDPLNDLVERFSWIMLFATVSLGIQKLLLTLSSTQLVTGALAATAAVGIAMAWFKGLQKAVAVTLVVRLVVILLLLRFATIGFVALETVSFEHLMRDDFVEATETLNKTEQELKNLERTQSQMQQPDNTAVAKQKDDSWFPDIVGGTQEMLQNASKQYDKAVNMMNFSSQLKALEKSIDDAQRHIISLATIFIVQTVLLPLLFLWIVVRLASWVFRADFDPLEQYRIITKRTLPS